MNRFLQGFLLFFLLIFSNAAYSACTVTITKTDVTCNGGTNGTATATPAGAPGPYSYSWSPSGQTTQTATGLQAGMHTVTVTAANGCVASASITINQPTAITLNLSSTPATCANNNGNNNDGSATVNASGGTPGYTYSWAPYGGNSAVASNLLTGTYTVTVTDSKNCVKTGSVTVGLSNSVSATFSPVVNQCFTGNTYNFTNTGTSGGGTTHFWYFGGASSPVNSTVEHPKSVVFTAPGTYTVSHTVTVGFCSSTYTQVVTIFSNPSVSISSTNVSCFAGKDGTATATISPAGAYTYNWLPSGGNGATASNLSAGTYSVTVSSSNGCTGSASVIITQPSPFVATITKTNISCKGGSNGTATVSLTGSPGPYTYAWAPFGGSSATATGLTTGTYTVTATSTLGCTTSATTTITEPLAITFNLKKNQSTKCGDCNGAFEVELLGGTPPFTYVVSPTTGVFSMDNGDKEFEGNKLCAGNYQVTFTDANGCKADYNWLINYSNYGPASISSQTNVSCFGGSNGSATATVVGGTAPYTYIWLPGGQTTQSATGLAPGTYTVSVTDIDTCRVTTSVTITQPAAPLSATTSQVNVSCFGGNTGSATVAVSGGTPGYSFSWAPYGGTAATASGLVAGSYTVTITDAKGCQATKIFNISQPLAITATTSQTNILCNGGNNGAASVFPSGGTTPYTYFWMPVGGTASSVSGLTAGTYTTTITDNKGCTLTKSVTITQPAALTLTSSQTNVTCIGLNDGTATAIPAGGTPGYSYSWSTSPVQTSVTATGLAPATYTVTVTDLNSCTAAKTVTITQPVGLSVTVAVYVPAVNPVAVADVPPLGLQL